MAQENIPDITSLLDLLNAEITDYLGSYFRFDDILKLDYCGSGALAGFTDGVGDYVIHDVHCLLQSPEVVKTISQGVFSFDQVTKDLVAADPSVLPLSPRRMSHNFLRRLNLYGQMTSNFKFIKARTVADCDDKEEWSMAKFENLLSYRKRDGGLTVVVKEFTAESVDFGPYMLKVVQNAGTLIFADVDKPVVMDTVAEHLSSSSGLRLLILNKCVVTDLFYNRLVSWFMEADLKAEVRVVGTSVDAVSSSFYTVLCDQWKAHSANCSTWITGSFSMMFSCSNDYATSVVQPNLLNETVPGSNVNIDTEVRDLDGYSHVTVKIVV